MCRCEPAYAEYPGQPAVLNTGDQQAASAQLADPGSIHRRLSSFYLLFYGVLGAFLPYWALWLVHRGYEPWQIGAVFGALGAARLFAPLAWAWLADRSGQRLLILRLVCLLALLIFVAISQSDGFVQLLLLTLVFALFWHAAMPLFETLTLDYLQHTGQDYTRIRLWGSVGFVLSVLLLGPVFDLISIAWLPALLIAMLLGLFLSTLRVVEPPCQPLQATEFAGLTRTLKSGPVLALLAICFLSQFSFAPYYGFFSIFLEQHGYSRSMIGGLWAWGVIAEIGVFLVTGRVLRRFGVRRVMMLAMASTALRWAALPWVVDSLPALLLLQSLHLSSFGLYHACAIALIHRHFSGGQHARGQALYSAVSFGLGGGAGALITGWAWGDWGASWVFSAAGVAGLIAMLVALRGLQPDHTVRQQIRH